MLTFLFYIFLAYMLYQLVFKFILPVYRTTRRVKKSFREMQEQMNARASGQAGNGQYYNATNNSAQADNPTGEKKTGEYIDFEEIKD